MVFDKELRWKEHVQQAVKRATQVNIALGGIRHLRPEQMRQLYQACVVPIVDYASTVWHNPLKDKTHLRALGTVQRTALIRVLSAFKTVSTAALEIESFTLPTHLRMKQCAEIVTARLCTLPWKQSTQRRNRHGRHQPLQKSTSNQTGTKPKRKHLPDRKQPASRSSPMHQDNTTT